MIVSHACKFVFFHNPKAAGTSMRNALWDYHDDQTVFRGIQQSRSMPFPLDLAHLRCCELDALFPQLMAQIAGYRSLVLVRNPYLRFVSAVAQHYKIYWPAIPLAGMERARQLCLVEGLVQQLTNDIARVVNDFRYVHFTPQTWFICSGERQLPASVLAFDESSVFREQAFECLGLSPLPMRRDNASRIDLMHVLGSAKVLAFVQAFYQPDFAFLAADPTLAHLAAEV